jgi:hypothetical protein
MLWVARYFPRVKALGGELTIECRPELLPLIETMGAADGGGLYLQVTKLGAKSWIFRVLGCRTLRQTQVAHDKCRIF